MDKTNICIIGAGASGLSSICSFLDSKNKGETIPNIVCYEKQKEWGGLWNYNWRTGLDEFGEPVHNSMYRHLWSNGPKECLEFSNYSFDQHFQKPIPSYPPREVLYDYITGRFKNTNAMEIIKFSHVVKSCKYYETVGKFKIIVHDNINNKDFEEYYDWVICATGHFSTPNVPQWSGMDTFPGRIIHSHDFRNAEEMSGKDILIIGTSYSAEDIASQCFKYGVKSVTLSWRTKPMKFNWPDNFTTVPLLEKIIGNTCYFKDTSTKKIDTIILCTGYLHHFPYMNEDLKLKTNNRLYPNSLYDGVVYVNNPKLFYVGMQDQWFTFNMFDAQAWYIRDVILGKIKLPDKNTMIEKITSMQTLADNLDSTDEAQIRFQANYLKELLNMTDLNDFDIEGVVKCFLEWEHNKEHNIMEFRDYSHTSLITGTNASTHKKKWLNEYDDSLENFLNVKDVRHNYVYP